jgi:hypothetical protein
MIKIVAGYRPKKFPEQVVANVIVQCQYSAGCLLGLLFDSEN